MLYQIKPYIKKLIPDKLFKKIKNQYQTYKRNNIPFTSELQIKNILINDLDIKQGMTVFIHSSINSFKFDFSYLKLIDILLEIVGQEGTLLFPCHQTTIKSTFEIKNNIPFNVKKTPGAVGILPELARRYKNAYRSLHPTTSVVALGKHAKELTEEHHKDIFPCGEKSPYYKIMNYNGIVIGLGVNIECLTFVHVVEDIMKGKFPIIVRDSKIYKTIVIDKNGNEQIVETLIANENAGMRDLTSYFKSYIPNSIYKEFIYNKAHFFKVSSKLLFDQMINDASKGITLYKKKAYNNTKRIMFEQPNFNEINN